MNIIFDVSMIFKGREWTGNKERKCFSIIAKSEKEALQKILKNLGLSCKRGKDEWNNLYYKCSISEALVLKIYIKQIGTNREIDLLTSDWFDRNKIYLYKLAVLSKFPLPELSEPGNDLYWEDKEKWQNISESNKRKYDSDMKIWDKNVRIFECSKAGLRLKKKFRVDINYHLRRGT